MRRLNQCQVYSYVYEAKCRNPNSPGVWRTPSGSEKDVPNSSAHRLQLRLLGGCAVDLGLLDINAAFGWDRLNEKSEGTDYRSSGRSRGPYDRGCRMEPPVGRIHGVSPV